MKVGHKPILEIVSVLVLLGGLLLVAYQVNQATSIAQAEISTASTSRWRAVDATRQSENFAVVLAKSYETPDKLTLSEMIELEAYYIGVIDQMSAAYTMVKDGYRKGPIEVELKQAALTYFGNSFAKAWWNQYRNDVLVGNEAGFVVLFDVAVHAVSVDQDLDKFLAIKEELENIGAE